MKKIYIVILFLINQVVFSQNTKNYGDFDKIKVFDLINVKLVHANNNKIKISEAYEDRIEILNKIGSLKIRMQLKESFKGEKIDIIVYYKNLVTIDACEGSYVFSDETLEQNNLELAAKEGAEINLKLEVQNLTSRIISGGVIDIAGSTNNHISSVGNGAILKAKNLHSMQTYINVNTGGEAEVHAAELADAKVNMGGRIYIYGNPKQVNKKSVLGGTIIVSKE